MSAHKGEAHHRAKLTPEIVREARELHAEGVSYMRLAERLDWLVHPETLRAAVTGKNWRHVR